MTNFALYGSGLVAGGLPWSSRVYATGSVAEATAATAIHTAWDALFGDITTYLPAVTTLSQTAAYTLNASWKFTTGTTTAETAVGTAGGDSMPISTCAVITWRTPQRTKKGHGRSFMPPSAVGSIASAADTGKLLPAFQSTLSSGAAGFLANLTSAGLTMVILNRATLTPTNVTSANVGSLFRQQRRRQSKLAPTYV
jgi:hypothetical protein